MVAILVSIPVLGLAMVFQTAIFSRINLLAGSADLILLILAAYALQERVRTAWIWAVLAGLMVGAISALPVFIPPVGYLLVVGAARILQRRIWQAPLLAMFILTFFGTILMQIISYATLRFSGDPLPLGDTLSLVILPSVLLNMLISIPVYFAIRDLARWLYPAKEAA